jgi:selenoprotein W-related protein
LTESLLDEFADDIASWTLRPSGGGRFEVTVNGELVFSKKRLGRHPKKTELADLLRARIAAG